MDKLVTSLAFAAVIGSLVTSAVAQDGYGPGKTKPIPRRVYWGDTHLHTSFSPDASLTGNFRLGPADAYTFASGGRYFTHKN